MSKCKILITGGNGFIGKHCIQALAANGHDAVSLDITDGKFRKIDLGDSLAVETRLQEIRPTHLLHLAWYVTHGDFWESPKNLEAMTMTLNLFQSFAASGGKRFVGIGTCAEYDWSIDGPYREDSDLRPQNLYGLVKKQTSENLTLLAKKWNISCAWARPFFPFGPGEPPQKLVPSILQSLFNKSKLSLSGGPQQKDFIYVKDLAQALATTLTNEVSGPVNMGTGHGYTVRDVALTAAKILSLEGNFEWLEQNNTGPKMIAPMHLVADTKKLFDIVGFRPHYNLITGIEDYLKSTQFSSK